MAKSGKIRRGLFIQISDLYLKSMKTPFSAFQCASWTHGQQDILAKTWLFRFLMMAWSILILIWGKSSQLQTRNYDNYFINNKENSIKEIITMPKRPRISMIMTMTQCHDTMPTTKISMELAARELFRPLPTTRTVWWELHSTQKEMFSN